MEELLMGKYHSVATQQFLHANFIGRLLFAHKLNIYLMSVQETQLRLYDELQRVLREFLSAVRILSKGYLLAFLFPPTILSRITSNALQMVQKKNPDYVLTIKHVTEYYDMKMVTFGINDGEELVVAFPVFVQDHTRESMTLYELETVKVPIIDTNLAANSYTEVETSKPYIAFNNDYNIQFSFQNCACVNKSGTVTTVKNYFWSSINPNIAVKVPSITIYPKKSLMNTVHLSISTTQQSCPVF